MKSRLTGVWNDDEDEEVAVMMVDGEGGGLGVVQVPVGSRVCCA